MTNPGELFTQQIAFQSDNPFHCFFEQNKSETFPIDIVVKFKYFFENMSKESIDIPLM